MRFIFLIDVEEVLMHTTCPKEHSEVLIITDNNKMTNRATISQKSKVAALK